MTKPSRKPDGVRDRITGAGGSSLDETIYAGLVPERVKPRH